MGVSVNGGTPKSSILIGFSIVNHPFWGTTIFGNTHNMAQESHMCRRHRWKQCILYLSCDNSGSICPHQGSYQPKQGTIILGKSLKFTMHLHCFIPNKNANLVTPAHCFYFLTFLGNFSASWHPKMPPVYFKSGHFYSFLASPSRCLYQICQVYGMCIYILPF